MACLYAETTVAEVGRGKCAACRGRVNVAEGLYNIAPFKCEEMTLLSNAALAESRG